MKTNLTSLSPMINSLKTFASSGFRSVKTDGISEAAEIFANRAARRQYGKRGYARTCNQTAYSQDGRLGEYSAFIGYKTGMHETTGNNINFTVEEAL